MLLLSSGALLDEGQPAFLVKKAQYQVAGSTLGEFCRHVFENCTVVLYIDLRLSDSNCHDAES